MQSKATSVTQYLAELPADRRAAIEEVRRVVKQHVDASVEEGMQYGMISFHIPHRIFPDGYHCDPKQPVPYVALASQKNYMAIYMMFAYVGSGVDAWIRKEYAKAGRRLDMGKCCLRFRTLDDLDLEVVAEAIRRLPATTHLENYVTQVGPGGWKKAKAKSPVKKKKAPPAKKK